MQTLGVAESTPAQESRWRTLFWPTIRNATDLDAVTRQGFWMCAIVAVMTTAMSAFTGHPIAGAFEGLFFFLAGVGVRERSRFAAVVAFLVYVLSSVVLLTTPHPSGWVLRIICSCLLLANVRGIWLSSRWTDDDAIAPERLNESLADKLVDQLPAKLWPKGRYVFYVFAVLELLAVLFVVAVVLYSLMHRSTPTVGQWDS